MTADDSLYAGSARYYAAGRMPYPSAIADVLRDELHLDGTGRLLDVGSGPGSLLLLLAPLFGSAVGVDADADMLRDGQDAAERDGISNVTWQHLRAEAVSAELGTFRVVTFAQSFHWMDRPLVASRVRSLLEPGGAWVHVSASTDRGVADDDAPPPPWADVDALVARYLGPVRRAGRGFLPHGTVGGEEDVMRDAGYAGPRRVSVVRGELVERTADDVVAATFSLSSSAPHLFGDRLDQFEADLRDLLGDLVFTERARDVELAIWTP
ncbi:methyltransferase domain-containing protein [Cellulomonas sp. McL0617]|uniref:methyltransferase domain-containing protein n=1 Tax=Cellulomonas sp. McL0617 TaxID=3415675 RepID=UPI003CEE9831